MEVYIVKSKIFPFLKQSLAFFMQLQAPGNPGGVSFELHNLNFQITGSICCDQSFSEKFKGRVKVSIIRIWQLGFLLIKRSSESVTTP